MSDQVPITLTVNGQRHEVAVEPRRTLVDVLRFDLKLTGTHVGCEHGVCGACTILIDGEPARSCILLAVQVDGAAVETVEGLGQPDSLSPMQSAFAHHGGLQCGFCTPGFLMLAEALRRQPEAPTGEEVTETLASNLCRCTGYRGIVNAVDELLSSDPNGEQ